MQVVPATVAPGDEAVLEIKDVEGTFGLLATVERLEGDAWEPFGILIGGPGKEWRGRFQEGGPEAIAIPDIGFEAPAEIQLTIPSWEPGRYRITKDVIGGTPDEGTVEERTTVLHAEFEITESVLGGGDVVDVDLYHCGFEELEWDGDTWISDPPPFDATNAPDDFAGTGTIERTGDGRALYTDTSGAEVEFTIKPPGWEAPLCM
jgi:hypothetical protein